MSRSEIGQRRRLHNLARALQAIAAKVAVADEGLPACSMADLVDASTISRGSFYNYFDDRSSVAYGLATFAHLTIELHIESKHAELSGALEQLAMSYHAYLAFAIDNGSLATVMIDDFVGRFPDIRTYLPETLDRGDRTLRAAIDDGDLNPKSLDEINRDVVTGGLALSMKRLSRGFRASDEWLMDTTTGLLMALGAQATQAEAASQRAFHALGTRRAWPLDPAALAAARALTTDRGSRPDDRRVS